MSFDDGFDRDENQAKWSYSNAKLYGWLTGLMLAGFGGLMCAVPAGAFLGVPVIVAGLLMSLSFSVTMSATAVSRKVVFPILVIGIALVVFGRYAAPVRQVLESFETGRTVLKNPGVMETFGLPILLVGIQLIQMVVPWLRDPRRLSSIISTFTMILIQGATFALLIGAVMTARTMEFANQPYWVWLAVPVAMGVGVALRTRGNTMAWLVVFVLTGIALPLTWQIIGRLAPLH